MLSYLKTIFNLNGLYIAHRHIHQIVLKQNNQFNIEKLSESKNSESFGAGIGFCIIASVNENKLFNISKIDYNQNEADSLVYSKLEGDTQQLRGIKQLSCGRDHCLLLSDDGNLYSIGNNSFGQCGLRRGEGDWSGFRRVDLDCSVKQVVCGLDHSLLLTDEGSVLSCGLSTDGQTGSGNYNNIFHFQKITAPSFRLIACSADTVLALPDNVVARASTACCWGNNEYGQLLGVTSELQATSPVPLPLAAPVANLEIVDAMATGSMCFLVSSDNEIYGWGLGRVAGTSCNLSQPSIISMYGTDGSIVQHEHIKQVCGSVHYAAVLMRTGRLFLVGSYPHWDGIGDVTFTNEVALPRPASHIGCGSDRIFVQFHEEI